MDGVGRVNEVSRSTHGLRWARHEKPVIAIVGAGPSLGLALATTFGTRGFNAALLSRSASKLAPTVIELAKRGVEAAAFHVDPFDCLSIASGIASAKQRFGKIDVLEFSPIDQGLDELATDLKSENVQSRMDFTLQGAVAAVKQVLPNMLARASGTILFTIGTSSDYPCLRWDLFADFAQALHAAVSPNGVQVGYVTIGPFAGCQLDSTYETLARHYWELHTQRDQVEKLFVPARKEWCDGPDEKARHGNESRPCSVLPIDS